MVLIGAPLSEAEDVIVMQHGLPPRGTILAFENKARELVAERERVAVLVADARKEPFSMGRFVNQLTVVARQTRQAMAEGARLHLVGHSYGGVALLKALRFAKANPDSAHFLAPFVKNSSDNDPAIAMSITNDRLLQPQSLLRTHDGQLRVLGDVLSHLEDEFVLPEDYDPVEDHRKVFSRRFFDMIGNLSDVVDGIPVSVVLGGRDVHIGEVHARFIADLIGRTAEEITHVFPDDTHDLGSWHPRQVLETPSRPAP